MFTCHFVPWSNDNNSFQDVYAEKLKKLEAQKAAQANANDAANDAESEKRLQALGINAGKPDNAANISVNGYADPTKKNFTLEEIRPAVVGAGRQGVIDITVNAAIDPMQKEQYLSDADFEVLFGMPKSKFNAQAAWKKKQMKQKHGLF